MTDLEVGSKAPKFHLNDKDGVAHGIGSSQAHFTVLFFYPKDNTPGCTVEAQEFSDALKEFSRRKVRVIGISGGDSKTKEKFCSKYQLMIDLVSDTDFSVSKAYGVYGEKKFMGRTYQGIHRTTFVVNPAGKIAAVFRGVTPKGHAHEVLGAVDALLEGREPAAGEVKKKTGRKSTAAVTTAEKKVVEKTAKK